MSKVRKNKKRAPLSFSIDKPMRPDITNLSSRIKQDEIKNAQTHKQSNAQARTSRVGRQFIAAHVPPLAAKQFKILALQEETTTQDLLVQAINDLFSKHGLSRIA